ncbi:hypothetical protein O7632_04135 [Solwaraspora sp. WMMD406]|uniref:hypothetical protein n=1 Tax=Solwaraspora sp. WMMD406 TaxID=3016095 RepID=UPI00241724DF|nr:hypothetical protein [Solwaraspora sp. WMMD406]MDG4763301.1 hypothetical protein [Solwaraspora sp. WMMD406]
MEQADDAPPPRADGDGPGGGAGGGAGGGRRMLGFLIAVLPVAVVVLVAEVWRHRLPTRLPTHWNAADAVDATSSLTNSVTGFTIGAAAGAVIAAVGVLPLGLRWRLRRALITVGAAVAGFIAGIWLITVSLAVDVVDPYRAPAPTWHLLALLVGVAGWTALAYLACGAAPPRPAATGAPSDELPRSPLPSDLPPDLPGWVETGTVSRAGWLAPAALVVLAVVMGIWLNVWIATVLLLAAALVVATSINRLVIDRRGIHIGFGPYGWPRITVPVHEIVGARHTTVRVSDWGGWGYRHNADLRGRGLILRSGAGVRVELTGRRYFVTTTRDPQTVAGLVNTIAELDDRRPGRDSSG